MQKLTSWKDRCHNVHSFFAPQFVEHRMRLFLFGSVGRCCVKALWESHCHPHRLHHPNPGLVSHLSATCPCLMLGFLLRRCGVYGLYFHNDEQRFVLSISVERDRHESDENNQNEPKQETLLKDRSVLSSVFLLKLFGGLDKFFFLYASVFLLLRPQEEQSSGWSTGWFASFFSGRVDPFTRGGICTQSLLAVLKANAPEAGWRSLDFNSLLRQIGNLLNRQRESAGVAWYDYDYV